MHKQKPVVWNISEKAKTSKQVVVDSTSTSEPKPSHVTEQEDDWRETIEGHERSKQPSIKHFIVKDRYSPDSMLLFEQRSRSTPSHYNLPHPVDTHMCSSNINGLSCSLVN